MSTSVFYPWHRQTAEHWLGQLDRFAHAWLIHGNAGIGKVDFAFAAASFLLCEHPTQTQACGHCVSCIWIQGNNHPDFLRVRPASVALDEGDLDSDEGNNDETSSSKRSPSKEILVDQIRHMEEWALMGAHRAGKKIILLYPAESLNHIAANSLLKILEEPPKDVIFFLISDHPERLLPTITSRCRRLGLGMPERSLALDWLRAHGVAQPEIALAAEGGAPVAALRHAHSDHPSRPDWLIGLVQGWSSGRPADLSTLIEALESTGISDSLLVLQRVLLDLQLACAQCPPRYYPDLEPTFMTWAHRTRLKRVTELSRSLTLERRTINHPLNAKLLLQTFLQRIETYCIY